MGSEMCIRDRVFILVVLFWVKPYIWLDSCIFESMSEDEVPVIPPEEEEEVPGEEAKKSPAERLIKCKYCGKEVVFKNYMKHLKENHPEAYEEWRRKMSEGRKEAWARVKAMKEVEEEEKIEEEEMPPEQLVSLYGREGLDKLKRKQLEKSLRAAPKVSSSQINWVLYRWDTYSRCREDAGELFRVIHEEAGINERIANAIVQSVFSIEAQYGHLLARSGQPVFIGGPRYGEREPEYIYQRPSIPQQPRFEYPQRPQPPAPPATSEFYPQQPYTRGPWYEYSPWYRPPTWEPVKEQQLTKEDVRKMMEEFYERVIKEKEEREEKERLWKIVEGLKDLVEETRHEFDKKILEVQTKKAGEEESPEVRELKARLERYEEEIRKLEKTLEERERKALESKIRSLESELRAARQEIASLASRPSEGYSQDTYKLMADTLHVIAQRKPLHDMARILFPEKFYPQTQPTSSKLPPEVEEELEKYGLIER